MTGKQQSQNTLPCCAAISTYMGHSTGQNLTNNVAIMFTVFGITNQRCKYSLITIYCNAVLFVW